jgi:hypothetical protein
MINNDRKITRPVKQELTGKLPLVGPHRERALQALSRDPLDDFPGFVAAVSQRLEKGREAYGDTSFDKPIIELLGEIEQECLDLTGWGFILWVKLQSMKRLHDTQYKLRDTATSQIGENLIKVNTLTRARGGQARVETVSE